MHEIKAIDIQHEVKTAPKEERYQLKLIYEAITL